MHNEKEFSPNWASSPGDTINDILQERHISEIEFAHLLGQPLKDVRDLLQGRATITLEVARRLEQVVGASVEFWMVRDFQYRQDIARFDTIQKEWLAELPISDMIKFGWLKAVPHPLEEVTACLRFFNVSSISVWRENNAALQQAVAFRTSPSYDSKPAAVAAWLRQGEIEAEGIACDPWNAQRFQESLAFIRSLTRKKDPDVFIPELKQCCSKSGVAVTIVRAPTGCRASGATRFLSQDKALLMLSFRYLTDDNFWFTFFHEAGHLLLHGEKGLFLEGFDTLTPVEEKEANEFAEKVLIPKELFQMMSNLPADRREIVRFAKHIGVSSGIIVGQLQHLGKIRRNQLNDLKRYFKWNQSIVFSREIS